MAGTSTTLTKPTLWFEKRMIFPWKAIIHGKIRNLCKSLTTAAPLISSDIHHLHRLLLFRNKLKGNII